MYDDGKILYVGGGIARSRMPSPRPNESVPQWKTTDPMHFARRQHNATLLPDGTVLVMGGTQGTGGETTGSTTSPRASPSIRPSCGTRRPATGRSGEEAAVDRCYHSIAVLLPDATVLSAGGGEFNPPEQRPRERAEGQP